jgi:hypothetical protein
MMLSIDYDDTYTRDPIFWDGVIALAINRGHSVICVTSRDEYYRPEVEQALSGKVESIICTGGRNKHMAAYEAGYMPSVWIDDQPQFIHNDALGGKQ